MIKVLKDRHILLGITGGIAAFKAAALASRLVQEGAKVDVVMSDGALKFIQPLTFQALTHRPVYTDMFTTSPDESITHISLAQRADIVVIAPATANTLAKIAHGLADNLLTAIILASNAPLLLAPAMETHMWQNPVTQRNIAILGELGAFIVGPEKGYLASGGFGEGRMLEPELILEHIRRLIGRAGDLAGRQVVITAGGTREPLDPVRFISNYSSGKMGNALALAARDRGAQVTLISSSSLLPPAVGIDIRPVETAGQMCDAVLAAGADADILIMAAAVADYRPQTREEQKIKKLDEALILHLERTPDILTEVAAFRQVHQRPKLVVGFAAETQDLLANARQKLERKNLDLIVANDISRPQSGFAADTNRVTLLGKDGSVTALPLLSKDEVAEEILERVVAVLL